MGACQSSSAAAIPQITKSGKSSLGLVTSAPSVLSHREKFDDVKSKYEFGKELSRGDLSVLHIVKDKETGEVRGAHAPDVIPHVDAHVQTFICKTIHKSKVATALELKEIQKEIQIHKYVSGHASITRFINTFEDKDGVHIIFEECKGGDLFDRIVREKAFTEQAAARTIHAVVGVVQHLHGMNVVHRSIKPEICMHASTVPDAPVKVVSFQTARFWKEGDPMDELVGNPHYVAPEMLRGNYGREVDVWSCGVLLYVLLSGYPPFDGKDDSEIFEQIVSCPLDLKSAPWPKISASAKDLVRKMLTRDPKRRITADQAIHHPWLKEQAEAMASDPIILVRMREFAKFNKFKKEVLKALTSSMPEVHLEGLRNLFVGMDKDCSGHISVDEMRKSLKQKGASVGQTEVIRILGEMDLDGNHLVDYPEFVAATMRVVENGCSDSDFSEQIKKTFDRFDVDKCGFISRKDVQAALKDGGCELSEEVLDSIMAEVDLNRDGRIDFEEFCYMIHPPKGSHKPTSNLRATTSRVLQIQPQTTIRIREVPLIDEVIEADAKALDGADEKDSGKRDMQHQSSGASAASVALSGLSSLNSDRPSRTSDTLSLRQPEEAIQEVQQEA